MIKFLKVLLSQNDHWSQNLMLLLKKRGHIPKNDSFAKIVQIKDFT